MVSNQGLLKNKNFEFNVYSTSKIFGNYFLHWGKVTKGTCSNNELIDATLVKGLIMHVESPIKFWQILLCPMPK